MTRPLSAVSGRTMAEIGHAAGAKPTPAPAGRGRRSRDPPPCARGRDRSPSDPPETRSITEGRTAGCARPAVATIAEAGNDRRHLVLVWPHAGCPSSRPRS